MCVFQLPVVNESLIEATNKRVLSKGVRVLTLGRLETPPQKKEEEEEEEEDRIQYNKKKRNSVTKTR